MSFSDEQLTLPTITLSFCKYLKPFLLFIFLFKHFLQMYTPLWHRSAWGHSSIISNPSFGKSSSGSSNSSTSSPFTLKTSWHITSYRNISSSRLQTFLSLVLCPNLLKMATNWGNDINESSNPNFTSSKLCIASTWAWPRNCPCSTQDPFWSTQLAPAWGWTWAWLDLCRHSPCSNALWRSFHNVAWSPYTACTLDHAGAGLSDPGTLEAGCQQWQVAPLPDQHNIRVRGHLLLFQALAFLISSLISSESHSFVKGISETSVEKSRLVKSECIVSRDILFTVL